MEVAGRVDELGAGAERALAVHDGEGERRVSTILRFWQRSMIVSVCCTILHKMKMLVCVCVLRVQIGDPQELAPEEVRVVAFDFVAEDLSQIMLTYLQPVAFEWHTSMGITNKHVGTMAVPS